MKKLKYLFTSMCMLLICGAATADAYDTYHELVSAYQRYGGDRYMIDEAIVQRSHVLQAAYFAEQAGAPEQVVIGLLLHDVGQIADPNRVGDARSLHYDHDELGATWAEEHGLPESVSEWIRYHTLAKVVLCERDPNYYKNLSKASQISYTIQKAKYENEARHHMQRFKSSPYLMDHLAARKCDDMAKQAGFDSTMDAPGGQLPGFEHYQAALVRVIAGEGRGATHPDWRERIDTMHAMMIQNQAAFQTAFVKANGLG